jgi:hypothetical protein
MMKTSAAVATGTPARTRVFVLMMITLPLCGHCNVLAIVKLLPAT